MRTFSVLARVLSALLIFFVGLLAFPAALFGAGYWVYNNVSFDFLEEKGVFDVEEEKIFSGEGEYSLTSMTLKDLIEEGKYISSIKDELNVNTLVSRYGLVLPETLDELLDDEMREKPIADLFSGDVLDDLIDDMYIGDLLNYVKVNNPAYDAETAPDESEVLWYSGGAPIGNMEAAIANVKLADLISGEFAFDSILDELKLADIFKLKAREGLPVYIPVESGWALVEDLSITVWFDEAGVPADAIIGAIAGYGIEEIETKLDELYIGDVIGILAYGGEFYSWDYENGEFGERIVLTPETGVTAELSDLTLNDISNGGLDEKLDSIEISVVLGYTKGEDGCWYNGETKVDGVMAVIADSTVGTLDSKIDGIKVGEIADFTYVPAENPDEEGTWYEVYVGEGSPENKVASGVLGTFASLTVDQMTDEEALNAKVKTLTVADALGYEQIDGVWYDGEDRLTGVMAVLAGTRLDEIQSKIDDTDMGELMDYQLGEDGKWYSYNETSGKYDVPVHVLMNKIAGTPFAEIDGITDELELGDIIPEENRQSGFIKLIPEDTKLDDIASEVNDIFDDTKLYVFVEEGIVVFDNDDDGSKAARFGEETELGQKTITGLFEYIIELQDKIDQLEKLGI